MWATRKSPGFMKRTKLGRLVIEQRVAANRVGGIFPGRCEPRPNVSSLDVETSRITAVTVGAADLDRALGMHVSHVGVAVDAALALGIGIGCGLTNQIVVSHRRWNRVRRVVRDAKTPGEVPRIFPATTKVGFFGTGRRPPSVVAARQRYLAFGNFTPGGNVVRVRMGDSARRAALRTGARGARLGIECRALIRQLHQDARLSSRCALELLRSTDSWYRKG